MALCAPWSMSERLRCEPWMEARGAGGWGGVGETTRVSAMRMSQKISVSE